MKFYIHSLLMANVLFAHNLYATNEKETPTFLQSEIPLPFYLNGSSQKEILTSKIASDGLPVKKTISLQNLIFSDSFLSDRKGIIDAAIATGSTPENDYSSGIIPFSESPGAVDLGMNNVPVLDQGTEGTCVTFSTTAAMDAVLGVGDFISQQCSLELDFALGQYYWDGAYFATQIIEPLKTFGIVQQGNCNATYPSPWAYIALWDYTSLASTTVTATNISSNFHFYPSLDTIKSALNNGHRVVTGFAMPGTNDQISVDGFDMTINGQTTTGGLWACEQPSSSRNYCILPTVGHNIVVIGYDDNQQLLKIRNSWGTDVGESGDFYMTYYYYSVMNMTGTEVY